MDNLTIRDDPAAPSVSHSTIIHNVEVPLAKSPEMGRPRSCPRDTRTGDSENPVHCAPSSGMVTRSKSCGASTGASLARKLLSRGASLFGETICGAPSRQQALVLPLAVTDHASRVVLLCNVLETIREYIAFGL